MLARIWQTRPVRANRTSICQKGLSVDGHGECREEGRSNGLFGVWSLTSVVHGARRHFLFRMELPRFQKPPRFLFLLLARLIIVPVDTPSFPPRRSIFARGRRDEEGLTSKPRGVKDPQPIGEDGVLAICRSTRGGMTGRWLAAEIPRLLEACHCSL